MSLLSDFKANYKLLRMNFLAYVITMIAIVALVGILYLIFSLALGTMIFLLNPTQTIYETIAYTMNRWTDPLMNGDMTMIFSTGLLSELIPLYAIAIWCSGATYGMSREIIGSGGKQQSNPFSWLRGKVKDYLAASIIISIVSIAPVVIIGYGVAVVFGVGPIPYPIDWIIAAISVGWFFVIMTFLHLIVPSMADELPLIEAVKESIKLAKRSFVKVFSIWIFYFVLLTLWFYPITLYTFVFSGIANPLDPLVLGLAAFLGVGMLIDVFLILPIMVLGMTRLYFDLKGEE
jgi:hypothetical protein